MSPFACWALTVRDLWFILACRSTVLVLPSAFETVSQFPSVRSVRAWPAPFYTIDRHASVLHLRRAWRPVRLATAQTEG